MKYLILMLLALATPVRAVTYVEMSSKRASAAFNHDLRVEDYKHLSVQIDLADAAPSAVTKKQSQVIDSDDDTVYIEDHNLPTGLGVALSTGANYAVDGLTCGVTYYVIVAGDDYIKLASSANNAIAGTAVDISSTVDVSSASFTLTPEPLASAATDGITYQASNDGVTFYALSLTSAPYDAVTTGALTQIVDPTYKLLRLKFTAPTTGALSIKANVSGRK